MEEGFFMLILKRERKERRGLLLNDDVDSEIYSGVSVNFVDVFQ